MTTTLMTVIMMVIMKSNAVQVTVRRGEAVQLTSDLQDLGMEHIQDIRWTHLHLLLYNKQRTGCDGRCELLNDGALSFRGVESVDEGRYIQEVFDREGKLLKKTEFMLKVETDGSRVLVHVSLSSIFVLLFLLIIIILYFIHRRRRTQRTEAAASSPAQENIYMAMRSYHGNKITEEVEGQQVEKVKLSTPITPQVPEEEDVYI